MSSTCGRRWRAASRRARARKLGAGHKARTLLSQSWRGTFFAMKIPAILALCVSTAAAQRPTLQPAVRQYVVIDSPTIAIRNVRVIDGTGAAPKDNQTIVIRDGKIASIGDPIPAGAHTID